MTGMFFCFVLFCFCFCNPLSSLDYFCDPPTPYIYVDIVCLTETRLNVNDTVVIDECTPPAYKMFYNFPRGNPDRRGVDHGGIAVIYKKSSISKLLTFSLML